MCIDKDEEILLSVVKWKLKKIYESSWLKKKVYLKDVGVNLSMWLVMDSLYLVFDGCLLHFVTETIHKNKRNFVQENKGGEEKRRVGDLHK